MHNYNDWTKEAFAKEYAAAIKRMMNAKIEKTITTFGGSTYIIIVGGSELDLPKEFFVAWRKLFGR